MEGDGAAEVRRRLCLEPLLLKTRELVLRCGQLVAHVLPWPHMHRGNGVVVSRGVVNRSVVNGDVQRHCCRENFNCE